MQVALSLLDKQNLFTVRPEAIIYPHPCNDVLLAESMAAEVRTDWRVDRLLLHDVSLGIIHCFEIRLLDLEGLNAPAISFLWPAWLIG